MTEQAQSISARIVPGARPTLLDAAAHCASVGYGKMQSAAFERGVFAAMSSDATPGPVVGRFAAYVAAGHAWFESEVARRAAEAATTADRFATLRQEFPDYDVATLPPIPEGFDDTSWHNNSAPSFESSELRLAVWTDYADAEQSEWPEMRRAGDLKRFSVNRTDADGAYISDEPELSSDEWADVEAFITAERLAFTVGRAFADTLREWATDEQWATMRYDNATGDAYQGERAACASHNFCDANMAMVEAFQDALGREPDVFDQEGGEEGPDIALFNAAWSLAKSRWLTMTAAEVEAQDAADAEADPDGIVATMSADDRAGWAEVGAKVYPATTRPTLETLSAEYVAYCDAEGLPKVDAMEALAGDLTPAQRAHISAFVIRWDTVDIGAPIPSAEFNTSESFGWLMFWQGGALAACKSADESIGWWRAYARAYGEGFHAGALGADIDNPHRQFSGAWEAWGAGSDDAAAKFYGA